MEPVIGELDTVALRAGHGRWPAGTTGTVVTRLDDEHVLVELAGADGATLALLPVAVADLTVLTDRGAGHGELAGRHR